MFIIVFFFLIYKVINELINFKNIMNKFLLERFYYDFNFKKIKYIKSIFSMYRDKRHIINNDGIMKTEKEILRKRFDFKRKL